MPAWLRDAWLVARKEAVHLRRDRRSQALTLVLPVVAMAAFAFSFSGQDVAPGAAAEPYPLAVKDLDGTAESREFLDVLSRTRMFTLHVLPAERDAEAYMRETGVFATVVLPEGFSEGFRAGKPQIGFVYDNTKPYVGGLALGRVKLVLDAIELQQGRGASFDHSALVETGGALDLFTPGMVVLLLAFTSLNDMATSLTRERSEGTLGRILLSPTHKASFLGGKILAGLALVLVRAALLLGIAIVFLGMRLHGDPLTYLLVALLSGLATLGLGILIAARARTEREVMVASLMVAIVLMFMMGAITPVELMSPPAQAFANALPHTHAAEALRRVMLLGYGPGEILPDLGILLASGVALTAAGVALFRRTLEQA